MDDEQREAALDNYLESGDFQSDNWCDTYRAGYKAGLQAAKEAADGETKED